MLVAVIILAVAAVVFGFGWLSTRRGLNALTTEHRDTKSRLEQSERAIASAKTAHAAEVEEFEAAAATSATELETANASLVAEKAALAAETDRASELDSSLTDANSTNAELVTERDAATARSDELQEQINALIDDRDGLRNEIDRAKQAPALVLPDASSNGQASSQDTLWKLELARSERTWAHSVAVNPESDESPLVDCEDPVRTAVEIEASALREEVGAFITIDWNAATTSDPARQHLLLRIAQEILAAAAREPEASTLRVSGTDDVTLELVATDDDSQVINLIAPQFDHELVDVASAQGLTVTVKAP